MFGWKWGARRSEFNFFPNPKLADRRDMKVPYVFILQQYCDGGHLEDLIKCNFTIEENLTWKEKVELERKKRRAVKVGDETLPNGNSGLVPLKYGSSFMMSQTESITYIRMVFCIEI